MTSTDAPNRSPNAARGLVALRRFARGLHGVGLSGVTVAGAAAAGWCRGVSGPLLALMVVGGYGRPALIGRGSAPEGLKIAGLQPSQKSLGSVIP